MLSKAQREELSCLTREGQLELVKSKLLEHADSEAGKACKGWSLFQIAVYEVIPVVVQALLPEFKHEINQSFGDNRIPLLEATSKDYKDLTMVLLNAEGIDINIRDKHGDTAFYWACNRGMDLEVIQALVAKGADINAANQQGSTPLMEAAKLGNIDVVKFLVEQGADVFARMAEYMGNQTALEIAKMCDEDDELRPLDGQIKDVIAYLTKIEKERKLQYNPPLFAKEQTSSNRYSNGNGNYQQEEKQASACKCALI